MASLEDLPNEILLEILSYLSFDHLHYNVALVCKRLWRLSQEPVPLACLQLRIDDNDKANFDARTLALHAGSRKLDIQLNCYCNGKKNCDPHAALNQSLGSFNSLVALNVQGKCCRKSTTLKFLSAQQKSMIISLALDFNFLREGLASWTNLKEFEHSRREHASDVVEYDMHHMLKKYAPQLRKIDMKSTPTGIRLPPWTRIPKPWPLLGNCVNLTSLSLTISSSQCWNGIARLTTLKSLGLDFDCTFSKKRRTVADRENWKDPFNKLESTNLEQLELHGIFNEILETTSIWQAIPSQQIKYVRISLNQQGREKDFVSVRKCVIKLADTFPNLEELVWDSTLTEYPPKQDFSRLVFNPPHFGNLRKLSMPYNLDQLIHTCCENVTELTFTWNKEVTMEDLYQGTGGILPEALTFYEYKNKLKRLVLEINLGKNFRIPDFYLHMIQIHAPSAVIFIKPL